MPIELSNFLPDFGTPFCRALKEDGWETVSVKTNIQYSVGALVQLNKNNPVAILFTPNGNYGKNFSEGSKLEGVVTKSSPTYPPKYNTFYIDLDIKQTVCKDRDSLFELAKDTWTTLGIEPTWITKKSGGPHIYWVIKPEDKLKVDEILTIQEFEDILIYLTTQFIGGDKAPARMTAYMRMPNTLHWKVSNVKKVGANPLPTKLYQWYDGSIQEEYNEEKKNYITYEQVLLLKELSKELKEIAKDTKDVSRHFNTFLAETVSYIGFEDLLGALERYPRKFKSHKPEEDRYNGMKYHFVLDGVSINLQFENGEILKTSGYKLKHEPYSEGGFKKRDVAFVNSFTQKDGVSAYNSYERPRGNIYSFLKNYFGGDISKILKFLKLEFNINVSNINVTDLSETDKIFMRGDSKLLCNKDGVFIEQLKQMPKGQVMLILKQVFDIPMFPIGYIETNIGDDYMETIDINRVYIFQDMFNNRRITLKRFNTKASFNKYINRIGLHCYAEEDTVATMFSIIDHNNIPKIDDISLNGVYDEFVLLGGQVIHAIEGFNPDDYYINPLFRYDILTDTKQISPAEFIEKMLQCFDERFVYLPILQYSAMMLMNIWKDKLRIPIYPSLLFTGTTGKGKSTIVDVMKSYGGYFGKSREFSLGGKTTSPQPIKQAATDNSILFLEELTGIVNPATEQAVRGIINRDVGSTGIAAGKNAVYKFKSPILALGQRTFTEDSINNRFVIMDMDHQMKRGTQQQLSEMKQYSCYKYIYEKYYENPDLIKSLYEKYAEKLIESDLVHRARDVVIFSFIMNEFLELNIDFDKLLSHVNRHLRNVGLEKPKQDTSPELVFKNVLISGFMKRAIFGTFNDIENNSKARYELHFSDDYLEQNRAKIHSSVAFFNDKANEEGRDEPMYMLGNMLVITIREVGAAKVDIVLDMIMKWLVKATKGVLTYVPTL